MDAQTHSYERSRPAFPRTASRSSTSTTNTRATSQSTGSLTSQVDPAQMATHRFHASCKSVTTPRTTPRATPKLSREASSESNRQATAVSSLLQERLQTHRQVEHEKAAMSRSIDLSASMDLGRISHGSPAKGGSDMRRPQSTAGSEKKKGLGVKDMETVISSLHKQNFDLKLELFHRRERQTLLEERVEKLESETAQSEEISDKLMQEIEKRDKAVEEAVAMIVMLEAKLEQFAHERGMVQQIEAEEMFPSPEFESAFEHPAPRSQGPDLTKLEDDARFITRMPSFLSDRSETTENLRNVYLGVKGSVISLPQVPEGAGDVDNNPANVLESPSLSVLSESSFVSVYGEKGRQEVLYEVDEPLSLDGADGLPRKASIKRPKTSLPRPPAVSNRSVRSNSISNTQNLRKDYQAISDIVQASPLQKIERLDPACSINMAESRPRSLDQDAAGCAGRGGHNSPRSPGRRRAREEKRASLRRVLTDAPGGVRLNDLPPTPDTISTSTLRRYRDSNDTLPKEAVCGQPSYGGLSDASGDEREHQGVSLESAAKPLERARELNNHAYYEAQARAIQRPRSADETTISHRRANEWDSDDDSDAHSFQSSLDIWMRESTKPDHARSHSPDLFTFAASGKTAWNAEAMFGSKGNPGIDPEQLLTMFPVQPENFSASLPPPPPNRRSSLLAQTGANPGSLTATKVGTTKPSRRTRGRRNSDDIQMRAGMKTPLQSPAPPPVEQKKNYPPIAGQQPAQNPLTKLFRRSLNRAVPSPVPSEPPTPEVAPEPKPNSNMGIPSWVNRSSAVEEDFHSATPPPIMRNPRHSHSASADLTVLVGGTVPRDPNAPGTPTMPTTALESVTPEQTQGSPKVTSATSVRRKWLPAFRSTGFKNRTG